MQTITLTAHYDGQQILLDEPFALAPDTKLLITVIPDALAAEREQWFAFSAQAFNAAYGDDEPEYTEADIKVPNSLYDGR